MAGNDFGEEFGGVVGDLAVSGQQEMVRETHPTSRSQVVLGNRMFAKLSLAGKAFPSSAWERDGGVLSIVKHNLPDSPLAFISRCVKQGKVFWTYHVNLRLKGRFIMRQAILQSIECYEIIEKYPQDKYLPSYLVYSEFEGDIFHILFAVDLEGENVRVVTAYRPDPEEWEEGFKVRREIS